MQHEIKNPLIYKGLGIGATGFEPATSRPPAVRATKLRHTPERVIYYQITKKKAIVFQIFFTILNMLNKKTQANTPISRLSFTKTRRLMEFILISVR